MYQVILKGTTPHYKMVGRSTPLTTLTRTAGPAFLNRNNMGVLLRPVQKGVDFRLLGDLVFFLH